MGLNKSCQVKRLVEVNAGLDQLALHHALVVQLDMTACTGTTAVPTLRVDYTYYEEEPL
jgi:hypothetical protein